RRTGTARLSNAGQEQAGTLGPDRQPLSFAGRFGAGGNFHAFPARSKISFSATCWIATLSEHDSLWPPLSPDVCLRTRGGRRIPTRKRSRGPAISCRRRIA